MSVSGLRCAVLLAGAMAAGCTLLPRAGSEDEAEKRMAGQFAEHCKKALCREGSTTRVRRADGTTVEATLDGLPIVLPNGWITIVQGETLHLELDVVDGEIRGARAVRAVANPEITVTLRFWQEPGRADSYFSFVQPFTRSLKYRLGIMVPNRPGVVHATSSCPVPPGTTMIEHWPQPLFQLVLANLRFISKDDRHICES